MNDMRSKFDMDNLKQLFCTKLSPDNVTKRLNDLEGKAKTIKSCEERIRDLEKDAGSMKSL